jgi:hypothetical protein
MFEGVSLEGLQGGLDFLQQRTKASNFHNDPFSCPINHYFLVPHYLDLFYSFLVIEGYKGPQCREFIFGVKSSANRILNVKVMDLI